MPAFEHGPGGREQPLRGRRAKLRRPACRAGYRPRRAPHRRRCCRARRSAAGPGGRPSPEPCASPAAERNSCSVSESSMGSGPSLSITSAADSCSRHVPNFAQVAPAQVVAVVEFDDGALPRFGWRGRSRQTRRPVIRRCTTNTSAIIEREHQVLAAAAQAVIVRPNEVRAKRLDWRARRAGEWSRDRHRRR